MNRKEHTKTRIKDAFLLPLLLAGASLILPSPVTAQCIFGPQVRRNFASITNYPGTCSFQFTNAANPTEDYAYLPLAGAAPSFVTTSSNWTASLAVNISTRQMTLSGRNSSQALMGLVVGSAIPSTGVFIFLGQWNNTGGGDDAIYPDGWYGTAIRFGASTNGSPVCATPLGTSLTSPACNGVYLPLSGTTSASPADVWCSNVTGVVTLTYSASTNTVTGYFNGIPVGSYSLAGWPPNPPLTLVVWGYSGKVAVLAGTATASSFYAGPSPVLKIIPSGNNVVLTWQTNFAFTLESTTNLDSAALWDIDSPPLVIVSGQNVATNPITSARKFYRLSH
jgi:hypothetical protein